MQTLLNLRETPFLPLAYQDRWSSVKNRLFSLVNNVSSKCCRIQAHVMKRRMREHKLSTKQLPSKTLYLANSPFYAASDYITRDSKVFHMLKRQVLKHQEETKEAKAREDQLLQRQLTLEETVRK